MGGCGGGGGGSEVSITPASGGSILVETTRCPNGAGQLVAPPARDGFWAKNAQAGTRYSGMTHLGTYDGGASYSWRLSGGFNPVPSVLRVTPNPVGAPSDGSVEIVSTGQRANINRTCSTAKFAAAQGRGYDGLIDTSTQLELSSFGGGLGMLWSDFGVVEIWTGRVTTSGNSSSWSGTSRLRGGVYNTGQLTPSTGVPAVVAPDWWPAGVAWTGKVTYLGTVMGWGSSDWTYTAGTSASCVALGTFCPTRREGYAIQGSVTVDVDFVTGRVLGGVVSGLSIYRPSLDTGNWTAATDQVR